MSDELEFHDCVFGQCTKCVSIIYQIGTLPMSNSVPL